MTYRYLLDLDGLPVGTGAYSADERFGLRFTWGSDVAGFDLFRNGWDRVTSSVYRYTLPQSCPE